MRKTQHGFSLIELLVVLGIITILIAIVLPIIGSSRRQANTVYCRAHLMEIGHVFAMYLSDNHQILPHIEPLPSNPILNPTPVWPPNWPLNSPPAWPSARTVFSRYVLNGLSIWKCPSDQITKIPLSSAFSEYYDRDGQSYYYSIDLDPIGNTPPQAEVWNKFGKQLSLIRAIHPKAKSDSDIWIFQDFENWHPSITAGHTNILYGDLHVEFLQH